MDTNNQKPSYYAQKPKPQLSMPILALLITLSVLTIVLAIAYFTSRGNLTETREEVKFVEEQKNTLEGELNELIYTYDSLKTNNDSVNLKLASEQEKIKKLLSVQASNTQKIKMYQSELETLRKVMRSYIVQIDSLNTRNRELTEENIQVRTQLKQSETKYQELHETKEELSSKVALAQKLTAKNIVAVGLNDRKKEKDRIAKLEKIRICFTIRENSVADAGKKMIYVRIIRPDQVALSSPEGGTFGFQNEQLVYSAKRELEFDNLDIDMCVFWDKTEQLIPGNYTVILYCEGYEIGSTTLKLL